MSILINETTQVLVQGITGRDGAFHTRMMLQEGTKIVAGVTPKKGGQNIEDIPIYNTIADSQREHRIDASVVFVPAAYATGAIAEAVEAQIPLIVCITEGLPVLDVLQLYHQAKERGLRLIGPNCPGIISPGKSKVGIMPIHIFQPGAVGVISRSGTLTYEVVYHLTRNQIGQSTCIGIGGDPIVGSGFTDLLPLFEHDPDTRAVVLIGEIGGEDEEAAAELIKANMTKPVVAFISGRTAPPEKRMGHTGAIISGGKGTSESKVNAFQAVNVPVADKPDDIPALLQN